MATQKANPVPDPDYVSEEVLHARAQAARYRLEFVDMNEF